jgi:hypothetical protein
MPCESRELTKAQRQEQIDAVKRLQALLASRAVKVKIGAQGALAFDGWTEKDRAGLSDVCAVRKLMAANSAELRSAINRAQVTSGRALNYQAVSAGVHSHDGGATWHNGH